MFKDAMRKLPKQLTDGLAAINAKKLTPEKQLSAALQLVRELLHELRRQVLAHPFDDKATEIYFFKYIKPLFLAAKIFEMERYNLNQSKPGGSRDRLVAYYEAELDAIRRFYSRYAFLYHYYKSGITELDNLYFVRGAEVPSTLLPEFGEPDPAFSTCGDYLFAKFNALEQLQTYINGQIGKYTLPSSQTALPAKPLRWTGEIVNLIELSHGIHLNGQINNGEIGIVELFERLGEFFGVSLGIPKKGFDDLKKRKRLSKTHFTDRMREALSKRMDDEDALDRNKVSGKGTGF